MKIFGWPNGTGKNYDINANQHFTIMCEQENKSTTIQEYKTEIFRRNKNETIRKKNKLIEKPTEAQVKDASNNNIYRFNYHQMIHTNKLW